MTITMDMARKAGWTQRNSNYGSDPQAMLYARAAGRLCKRIAQAELKGFVTMEEIYDGDEEAIADAPRTVTRTPLASLAASPAAGADAPAEAPKPARATRTRKAAARASGASGGLPPLPGEDDTHGVGAGAPQAGRESAGDDSSSPSPARPPSPEQMAAMDAAFEAIEVRGQARRDYVVRVLGREISHPGELTGDDVAAVLAELARPPFDEPDSVVDGEVVDEPEPEGQGTLT